MANVDAVLSDPVFGSGAPASTGAPAPWIVTENVNVVVPEVAVPVYVPGAVGAVNVALAIPAV